MARTYRRTTKGNKKSWLASNYYFRNLRAEKRFLEKHPEKESEMNEYFYWMTEPGWWIREFMTRPARQKCKRLLEKIKKGERDPDDTVYPDNKKPHIYYW